MSNIKIYTIGFTQNSAEQFFGKLIRAGVKRVISRLYTHEKDGRSGFWIQVNGIYTLPEFMTEVRTYD
jgi:hypothetical protein